MRALGTLAVVVLTIAAVLAGKAPSEALTRGTITISPAIGKVEKSYPGISGVKPGTPATPFAQVRNCKDGEVNSTHCDHVNLDLQLPPGYVAESYKEGTEYKVRVELNWVPGATKNDLTLWVFDFEDPALGPTVASDTAAGKPPPRVVQFFEPNKSQTFYMSIVNYGPGPNLGYTLKASWVVSKLEFPDAPKEGEPDDPSSYSPSEAKRPKTSVSEPSSVTEPPAEEKETITVKVPGPDGELIDVEIPLVKAAGVTDKAELDSAPLIPIVLGVIGLGFVAFLYFFVWRRRKQEEPA